LSVRFGSTVKKFPNRTNILSLLLAVAASFCFFLFFSVPGAYLEVRMSSTVTSTAQVFFDIGRGENETDSSSTTLAPSDVPRGYRFRIPAGHQLLALRFDALSSAGSVQVFSARLVSDSGTVLQEFSHTDFLPRNQFVQAASDTTSSTFATTTPPPGEALDPVLTIRLTRPILIGSRSGRVLPALLVLLLAYPFAFAFVSLFPRDPNGQYRLAVWSTIVFHMVHAAALPTYFSYDSMQYAHLARVLFTPSFPSDWDLQRSPLYPLALRLSFILGGDQPQAAMLPGLLYGLAGILILGSIAKRVAGSMCGAVAILVLSAYPYLVSYEHIPLTEIGTFFFLALLVWILLGVSRAGPEHRLAYRIPISAALVLALGFYHRPTIIYLAPVAAVLYVLIMANPGGRAVRPEELWRALRKQARPLAVRGVVIVLLPWLLCYPWTRIASRRIAEMKNVVLGYGMAIQGVIPADDPRLGKLGPKYAEAMAEATTGGTLRTEGLRVGTYFQTILGIGVMVNKVGPARIVKDYPARYLRGYIRTLIVYMGYPRFPIESESEPFSTGVFGQWPASYTLDKSLGWREVEEFPAQVYGGGAALGTWLHRLSPFYTWLVLCSTFGSLVWFVISVFKGDTVAMTMTGVPLGYLVLHALTLMSVSRYPFPTYPLLLACAICAAQRLGQLVTRFNRLRHASGEDGVAGEARTGASRRVRAALR
jgi:4-amino-4-deoxy-L-arabinose transferase-like glycosyltransferase